jgi:SPP1 gp7 family putative phage head morphogenesis protein
MSIKIRVPRRLPKHTHPLSQEREYTRLILKYVNTFSALLNSELVQVIPYLRDVAAEEIPVARDDSQLSIPSFRMDENIEAKIARVLDMVGKKIDQAIPDSTLRKWAISMVGGVNRNSKKNINKTMRSAYRGKDEVPDFEPLMHDNNLNPYFENIIDENVGLIKSVPKQKLGVLKNALVSLITQDATQKDISDAIAKKFKMDKNHASVIARDQVGKLNGQLNKYRQQQLGGKRYVWRTSKDSRVRPDHARLEGRVFSWSKPPIVDRRSGRRGNPGDDFCDRCWAEMVMEDVI